MTKTLRRKPLGNSVAHDHTRRRWLLAVVLAGAVAACIEPTVVQCEDGLACPANTQCDNAHHSCVLPDQLVACQGIEDGADCTTPTVVGGCFAGVCLHRGCGNGVVEPREVCDDGNQLSGDGCSGDCRSNEQCGNGFLDPDEECDDGDLQSRDGCDSRCRVEGAAWSEVIAIKPELIIAQQSAYDVARERLVYAASGGTWEWDGARWTFAPVPRDFVYSLFYDPDRGHVCAVIGTVDGVRLYAWIGGQWRPEDNAAGPEPGGSIVAVYDEARHRMMMIKDFGSVWTVDPAGSWVELPSIPELGSATAAVFDPESGKLVVMTDSWLEWVYDGLEWKSSSTVFNAAVSMTFDPERGHLVLLDLRSLTMYEQVAGEWSEIADSVVPCNEDHYPGLPGPLYYDRRGAALSFINPSADQYCHWDQTWNNELTELPFNPVGATYDRVTDRFVVLHNANPQDPESPTRAWLAGEAGVQRYEAQDPTFGRGSALTVYSPGRAATVFYSEQVADPGSTQCFDAEAGYDAETWSFDGASWSSITSSVRTGPPCSSNAAAYDPTHGRVVLATASELWSLGDTDHAWQRLGAATPVVPVSQLAWDARNNTLMAVRRVNWSDSLDELRGDQWTRVAVTPTGLPTGAYGLVSDHRAGTVIVIGFTGETWERAGANWLSLPDAPIKEPSTQWTAYDPYHGRVFYVARTSTGTFAAILSRTSPTPLESCHPDEDLDGDGLYGCSDPDCVWDCR